MGASEKNDRADSLRPVEFPASGDLRPEDESLTAESGERAGDEPSSGSIEVDFGDKRVLTRKEFMALLYERYENVLDIGESIKFVECVLRLQNDMSRPVFVFEVSSSITPDDIEYLDMVMNSVGIACVLVPSGLMSYAGEVTSESFGVSNFKRDFFGMRK